MILLALFVFQQTFADTTWPMYGATLENTHYQKMVGAMELEPYVKWSYVTGDAVETHGAAVADVDGDGAMEVVIGSDDNKLYCLDGTTGLVEWSYPTGDNVYSSPAVANVDGVAGMEVVFGSFDTKVYCLDGVSGTVKWSYSLGSMVLSSPAIADADGNGTMEVVVGSNDHKIYCLNGATGSVKWSYATGGDVISSPAMADVDGDDTLEVFIGSNDNKVYCLNGATGLVKWSYPTGGWVYCCPAVADVDGDGTMEVVIRSYDSKAYCLNAVTGLEEWSYSTAGWMLWASPAVADVDGDGAMEVVIGSGDGPVYMVYCLDGATGSPEWTYSPGGAVHRGISVADLDGGVSGECNLEILIPNGNQDSLVCLDGNDGSVLWIKRLAKDVHDITIADIDNDGCVELIAGTLGENKIWALDDIGDHTDCRCDSGTSVEENDARIHPLQGGIEFRETGGGTGKMPVLLLFTPNAIDVDLKLYDAGGRLNHAIYRGVLSKGGHTFMPKPKGKGIYFAVLRTQESKTSLKILRF